jgi:hypothetical protein
VPPVHLESGLRAAALSDVGDHLVAAIVDHLLEFALPGLPHLGPPRDVLDDRVEPTRNLPVPATCTSGSDIGAGVLGTARLAAYLTP